MGCSVVMTTYNGGKYIIAMLESLKSQKKQPDEVIICDDCSTDDTVYLVSNYISQNSLNNWNIIQNEINIGWKKNFRKALSLSKEDYIFLADQDDIWLPEKSGEMLSILANHLEISLLASNYQPFFSNGAEKKEEYKVKGLRLEDASIKQVKFEDTGLSVMRPGCTFCFRRSLLNEMFENDLEWYSHDGVLWTLALLNGEAYIYNRVLINFRRHGENATTPLTTYSFQRRLKEVENSIGVNEWALLYVKQKYPKSKKEVMIQNSLLFSKKRKTVLLSKSLFRVGFFAFINRNYYSTMRNMLGDIFVCLKSHSE